VVNPLELELVLVELAELLELAVLVDPEVLDALAAPVPPPAVPADPAVPLLELVVPEAPWLLPQAAADTTRERPTRRKEAREVTMVTIRSPGRGENATRVRRQRDDAERGAALRREAFRPDAERDDALDYRGVIRCARSWSIVRYR
jgi:hypothetical protein